MTTINGASRMNSMPINCGMKGMHENASKKQVNNDTNVTKKFEIEDSMSKNCGMKGMHDSNPLNSIETKKEKNNAVNNQVGSKLDIKA